MLGCSYLYDFLNIGLKLLYFIFDTISLPLYNIIYYSIFGPFIIVTKIYSKIPFLNK